MFDFLGDIGKGILGDLVGNIPIIGGIIKKVFKLDPDSPTFNEDAAKMLKDNPEKLVEFKKALFSHQEEMARIDVASRKLQTDINLADAKSGNKFQSNWRPFIGWQCGIAFGYALIIHNIFSWISLNVEGWIAPPEINVGLLVTTLGGMLGIGTLRSYDKKQGTDTK